MSKLSQYANRQAEGLPLRLDDIAGKEVSITAVEFKTGSFGPYAVMAIPDENGELQHVMTSAMLVLDALENAVAADALPITATFRKKGRVWIVE